MIRFITYENIEFEKWDKCIEQSVNGTFYASSWYLNLVCKQWDALILNDYEAIMPLPNTQKWGITYIYQPFLCQQLGVIHREANCQINDFISAIPHRFLRYTINLNSHNSRPSFVFKKNKNFELSLDLSIDELRANYSKSHLKNLKRAKIQNLNIASRSDTPQEFSMHKRASASNFMTPNQFELELKIIQSALETDKGEIFSVEGENGNCCSIFLMKDKKRLFLLSSYSNAEGRKKSAYFYLLDYIFSLKKFRGYVFDFEGSNLKGVAQRNKGFGASSTYYYTIHQNIWSRCLNVLGF